MKKFLAILLSSTLILASCDNTMASQGAGTGAYLGAILGSAIGGISNGPRGSDVGTIVGMATGAVVGAAIGSASTGLNKKNTANIRSASSGSTNETDAMTTRQYDTTKKAPIAVSTRQTVATTA